MSDEKMREDFEARYPMPFACGWNSMRNQYECIWFEHAGEEEVEAAIDQHNDRLSVWQASRAALVIDLPTSCSKKNTEVIKAVGRHIFGQGIQVRV